MRALAVWVALATAPAGWAQDRVVLVAPFAAGFEAEARLLGAGLADVLAADLQRGKGVVVLRDAALGPAETEAGPEKAAEALERAALAAAARLDATEVVVGRLEQRDGRVALEVRALEPGTGAEVVSIREEGVANDVFAVERAVATRLLDALGARVPAHARRALAEKPPELAPRDPGFSAAIAARSAPPPVPALRVDRARVGAGLGLAAAGVAAVGGTWAAYEADPSVSAAGWRALQAGNALGWVALVGGGALAASGVQRVWVVPGADGAAAAIGGRW